MADSVLVLGAGAYQVPLIRAAQKQGLRVVVASIPGDYPGFALADESAYIDTRDVSALLDLARRECVRAVMTAGTDVAMASVGHLNDKLGLCGVSEETAHMATNKVAMKRAFEQGGVRTARFQVVDVTCGEAACERIVEQHIGYPAIFKTVDLSGSRGIAKVFSRDDVARAYGIVRENSRTDEFLIEECLVGDEFGIELFVQDGKCALFMPNGKYLFDGSGTAVPFGHYAPFGSGQLARLARQQADKLVAALGVRDGAVNVDAMWCDGDVFVIEAGARTGATGLPELVSLRFGFDYYDALVRTALGERIAVPAERADVCAVSMLMGADRPGTVRDVSMPPQPSSRVAHREVALSPGEHVDAFDIGPDRVGLVVAAGETVADAERAAWEAIDGVECTLEDGNRVSWVRGRKM